MYVALLVITIITHIFNNNKMNKYLLQNQSIYLIIIYFQIILKYVTLTSVTVVDFFTGT